MSCKTWRAKYVESVDAIGMQNLSLDAPVMEQESPLLRLQKFRVEN